MQHTIHQAHKISWSISQTKWNYNKHIMTIPGSERSIVNVLFFDVYLMVSLSHISIQEHYCFLKLIEQVINPRQ